MNALLRSRSWLLALTLPLLGCWSEDRVQAQERMSGGGSLEARSGSALVGFVNVKRRQGTVRLFVNVLHAPPGEHAVRLHQHGDCSALDASSAGAVWMLEGSAGGDALGELGNLRVDDTGRGMLVFSSPHWSFGDGSELDLLGRALVIHERASESALDDSETTDVRLGCAVIR